MSIVGVLVVSHPAPSGAACTDPTLPDCYETVFGALPLPDSSESSADFNLPAGIDIDGTVVFAKCLSDQTHTDAPCAQPRTPCNINISGYARYAASTYDVYETGRATASSDCEPGRVDTIESFVEIAHACVPGFHQTSNTNSGTSPTNVMATAAQYVAKSDGTDWCAKPTTITMIFMGTFYLVKDKAPIKLCIYAKAHVGGSWVFAQC